MLLAVRIYQRFGSSSLRITVLDVGQGDAILVEFPYGKTLLVDGGGGFGGWNMGARVLVPDLLRRSILKLDGMVLTHPDWDHGFGLLNVMDQIQVEKLWVNAEFLRDPTTRLWKRMAARSEQNHIKIEALDSFKTWNESGVAISIGPVAFAKKRNDGSLVTYLEFAGCRVLLTGDIESAGEVALLQSPFLAEPIHLLKVAHHGSRTSSRSFFLSRAKPKFAVISVGRKNKYGHPNRGSLHRLSSVGADILRTDFHGYLAFEIDTSGLMRCKSYHGPCGELQCYGNP